MKQFLLTALGCLLLVLLTAMAYSTNEPASPVVLQEAPYKVVKGGIYLKAGLAIAFSNERTAMVYDPKSYVAVESNGNFTAFSRRAFNNTDCDCGRNQVCVNGKCTDIVRVKAPKAPAAATPTSTVKSGQEAKHAPQLTFGFRVTTKNLHQRRVVISAKANVIPKLKFARGTTIPVAASAYCLNPATRLAE